MKNSTTFKGWRKLRPHETLRYNDRWTFRPASFKSPTGMLKVSSWYEGFEAASLPRRLSLTVRAALEIAPYVFYRKVEKKC